MAKYLKQNLSSGHTDDNCTSGSEVAVRVLADWSISSEILYANYYWKDENKKKRTMILSKLQPVFHGRMIVSSDKSTRVRT